MLGEREIGIFTAIAYLMTVGSTVVGALGQSASPRLGQYAAQRNWSSFDGLTRKLVMLGAMLGAMGLAVTVIGGREILGLVYGREYALHSDVLFWLMIAYGLQFAYIFCGTALNAMRVFTVNFPIQLASCLVVIGLCALWIPQYGLLGAAWSMLGANLLECTAYVTMLIVYQKPHVRSGGAS